MNDNLEKILKHHPLLFPLFCYFVGQISKIAKIAGVACSNQFYPALANRIILNAIDRDASLMTVLGFNGMSHLCSTAKTNETNLDKLYICSRVRA